MGFAVHPLYEVYPDAEEGTEDPDWIDQAQSLEENAAAMSPERFASETRKRMRYESRTTSQRRKR